MDDSLFNLRHADDPLLILRTMSDLRAFGNEITEVAVADARERGCSWQQIADALRRTRQAVHRQYGPPNDA